MLKCMVFFETDVGCLEDKMNAWLSKNSAIEIVEVSSFAGVHPGRSLPRGQGVTSPFGVNTVVLIYKDITIVP
jgi:hypothetical protein